MKNRITVAVAFTVALIAAASCAQAQEVSFTGPSGGLPVNEGSTIEATFSVSPAPTQTITVLYDVDYDTADIDDHEPLSGEVELPAGATVGTIRISIIDDPDVEPPREAFDLRLILSALYTVGSQNSVTVNIREGICDRTPQVQAEILRRLAGIDDCDAVTNGDLATIRGSNLQLGRQMITSLKAGDFSGLTGLTDLLSLSVNDLVSLPAGVFAGLDNLRRLWLDSNDLTAFPSGMFNDLGALHTFTAQFNQIARLPEGFFLGAGMLVVVDLRAGPGAPFTLTPRLQRVGSTMMDIFPRVNAKLSLPEGTPFDIEVQFSTEGGTVSPDSVTLFRGTTQSDVVIAVTQTGAAPVRVTLNVPAVPSFGLRPDGFRSCQSNCYRGIATSGGTPFVLDAVAPAVSGAGFFSTPTYGDAYSVQAGETISVEVRFNEDVVVSGGPPVLRLNVGGMMRDAAYDRSLSSSTGLVFSYRPAAGDSDDDGVGFAADALVLNGAGITDPHGHDADLALGEHAVANDPGHRVAPRSFALRFEPAETVLTPGESTVVRLILKNTEALTGGEAVAVTLSTSALVEASLQSPTLGMPPDSFMTVTVRASEDAPFESGTLTASGILADARVASGELAVSVLQREVEVLISPDEFTLLRGGVAPPAASSTPVTIRTRPELRGGEIVALDLNAPGGLGLSPQSVTLSSVNQTATVQVSANMDGAFEGEVTVSTNAGTRTGRTLLHLDEASASVSVRRSVNLQFEWGALNRAPEPLRLEVGTSTTVEVSVAPPLLASEAIAVDLRLASGAGVRLNKRRLMLDAGVNSSTVEVTAQAPLVNDRLIAEPDPRGVHVASPPLSLDVQTTLARRVLLTFDPATVQFVPGRSMSFRVTTVPPLGPGQSLAAPLTVEGDAPLSFSGGVLTQGVRVSGETPSTIVRVTTSEAASWATAGSSAKVTVEREALMLEAVEILDPLPVLQVEVTTLHLSVSPTPSQELVLETGVPREVSLSVGQGELLPGESVRLEVVTDVPGLALEPRSVVLTADGPSRVRVTASQDNVQGALMFEAEAGVVLSEEASLDVRVKRDLRLRLAPSAVTLAAGDSADVRVVLEGVEELNAGQSVNLAVQSPEGIIFLPGPLSRLTPSRVASLRVSRGVDAGLGEHVVTITSAPDSDVRLLPARLLVTVLPLEVTVSFESGSVALLRGDSALAVVRADPALQFNERIDVELIPIAGFEVDPSRVLLERGSGSVQPVTISAGARTSDEGFIFLREFARGALTHASIRFGRGLETRIERGVELELTEEESESPAALGVPVAIRVATSPLLVTGESVEVRLRVRDDVLRLNEEALVLHGGRQSALFSATPRRPGVVGRITASGVGHGVTVVDGATLEVEARENAERVSLEFNPPRVQLMQGGKTMVWLTTRPLLGAGQSVSAVLEAGGGRRGVTLGASMRYQAVTLVADSSSQVVALSAPAQAEIGSTAVVSIVRDFTHAVGVKLGTSLPELTVEVVTPRITVSFASVGGGGVDVLLLGPGETETVEVRLDSGPAAVLKMETEGEGLTVSPAIITFPQPKPTTRIAVVKVSASAPDVAGTLKTSVASAAELSETPVLPVRVPNTLSFDPAGVNVKRRESKGITLRLGSTRSLTAGGQITVDLSALELAGTFGLSPNEVTFSAVQSSVTVEITAETDAPVGTVIRSRSQPWPAPTLESGSILLAEPLRVSVLSRTFEVLFEPNEIVLVSGGVAPATASATVTVTAAPEFLQGESIEVGFDTEPANAPLGPSVLQATLDLNNPTVQITVTATAPGAGVVRINATPGALSPEVTLEDRLSVEVIRAVESTLIGARAPLTMTAGESRQLTVTTNPPLDEDETAVVLLGAENGALSWNTPRLMLSKATTQIEVTVTADVPDTADRLTLSWQGEGVSVVGDLRVPVAIEQAATVSVVFEPEALEVGQGRSQVFRVTTDPPLADGQEASARLVLPAFPSGFSLGVDRVFLSGMNELQRSRQVEVSVSASTPIGTMASVGLDVISASGVDVTETLPSLPVTVTPPGIAIEFFPADELIVKNSRNVTLSLSRDGGLTGEQSASLDVSTSGLGLSVSPRTVELSGNRPSTVVTVEADFQAEQGRLGELRVEASSGAVLQAPAVLPVKVFSVTIAPEADENETVVEASEGETANAVVRVTPTPMTSLRVSYTVGGVSGDTADADDYSVSDGLVIPAGASSVFLSVKITDDDEIEPPRERFTIALDESLSYHVPTASSSIRVIIKEGACDRTPQVRDAIRGNAECEDVTSDDLGELTDLALSHQSIGASGLRVGDFWGLDGLTGMPLNDSSIFSLPAGIFAGLGKLKRLHLDDNELRDLPPGVFAGLTSLQQLHLTGNPVEPFVLTVTVRRANQPPAEPAEFKLVVEEGAPFSMNVGLTVTGSTASASVNGPPLSSLTIPKGSIESPIFFLSDPGSQEVRIELTPPPAPSGCILSQCYTGIATAAGAPFILDAVVPVLTGVEIISVPGGEVSVGGFLNTKEVYASGEVISVALTFNEEIVVLPEREDLALNLEIGSERRIAGYDADRSGTDTLVFSYEVAGDDRDSDGISVREDALALNGARLEDRSGIAVDPSLAGHEISNARDHVVLRTLSLVFDPPVVEVEWSRSATFAVTTRPPISRAGASVRVLLDLAEALGAGLDFAGKDGANYDVRLDVETPKQDIIVTAAAQAAIGSSVTLSYVGAPPFVQVSQPPQVQLRRPLPLPAVKVTPPKRTVTFSPADRLLLAHGGRGEVTLGFAGGETPSNTATLGVSADGGFSVEPKTVRLGPSTPTAVVTVTAPATTERRALKVEAVSGVALREAAELPLLSGHRRDFTLSFEPVSLNLFAGVSTPVRVVLGNAKSLAEDEVVHVALTPGAGLELSRPPVLLDRSNPAMAVDLRALLDAPLGASSVTAKVSAAQAQYLIARFDEAALPVGILERRITVLFEPARVELAPGTSPAEESSATVVIRTDPELVEDEDVYLNLTVLNRQEQLILSGARALPFTVILRPGADSQNVEVFASGREIALVRPQWGPRSTVEERNLRLRDLRVIFPNTGLQLRVKVFLEGALE